MICSNSFDVRSFPALMQKPACVQYANFTSQRQFNKDKRFSRKSDMNKASVTMSPEGDDCSRVSIIVDS